MRSSLLSVCVRVHTYLFSPPPPTALGHNFSLWTDCESSIVSSRTKKQGYPGGLPLPTDLPKQRLTKYTHAGEATQKIPSDLMLQLTYFCSDSTNLKNEMPASLFIYNVF